MWGVRRLVVPLLVSVCAFGGVFTLSVDCAGAATQFGSTGNGAGQLLSPTGVAVDAAGDVYVGDSGNHRVDKFEAGGPFALAWGEGVLSGLEEFQICTSVCEEGREQKERSTVGGPFGGYPSGVAVDDELGSPSLGDVYVADYPRERVEKYGPNGEFLLMFGGHVNRRTSGDVCLATEECGFGTEGAGDGEFSWSGGGFVAVGPGGDVYVGDMARVQVFTAAGAWKESISLSGLSSTAAVKALAVNATGDVYVYDRGVPGVREFEPGGIEAGFQLDPGSTSVTALALDAAGDVYVGDSGGGFHVLEYDSAGGELANFGSGTVAGGNGGLAFSAVTQRLYASAFEQNRVWVLAAPPPGPLIDSESSVSGLRGAATLEAQVDPEGNATTYHFEYVGETQYLSGGFASATSTPSATAASGLFEDHTAVVELTGLVPGGTYHYRLVADDSAGHATVGPDRVLETTPPALIEGPWATNVAGTSATLSARVDPLGASTEYRLEYGTDTSYGHALSGSVGSGMGYVPVGYHVQGLQAGTVYHYRVVTVSAVGTVAGADRTFSTQVVAGQGAALADGRAWELVSPPNKSGALIEVFGGTPVQAADDGSGIAYAATEAIGENPVGKTPISQILSRRGPAGWESQDITPPHSLGTQQEIDVEGPEYRVFSPDLSLAAVRQEGTARTPLSPEATEGKLYLRNDTDGSYRPLLTAANVPAGTKLEGEVGESLKNRESAVEFVAATPDLSHVIIKSELALTPGIPEVRTENVDQYLYEWSAGRPQLVSVLPDEEATAGAQLGGEGNGFGSARRAVSSDGRWVVWSLGGNPYYSEREHATLYVRDMTAGKTTQIGARHNPILQTMSSDGSRIFFLEDGELYEFDTGTATQMDLTVDHLAGEASAGVKDAVLGASEDGSYVYFVATGVLASGSAAVAGEDNLYVAHEHGGEWTIGYIATLSSADEHDWYSKAFGGPVNLNGVRSRVSPGGRYLAFMSSRSLTGYDNIDAGSGQPDDEVYLYDALTGHLVCASCDPTGARPVGVLDTATNVLGDRNLRTDAALKGQWVAGFVPGWVEVRFERSLYQPRYLSDSGRLFFDSPDALVPQDTNGLLDAYEYEPAGIGSCEMGSATFSTRSGGCVSLISSGTSDQESAFVDASETGNDVFFLTASRLSAADYDNSLDVYDAHVCTTSVPCTTAPVAPPPCTSGDSCKAAPSPQPEVFGAPPSGTFSGAGNILEEAKPEVVKPHVSKRKKKTKRRAKGKRRRGKARGHEVRRARRARATRTSGKGGGR